MKMMFFAELSHNGYDKTPHIIVIIAVNSRYLKIELKQPRFVYNYEWY